MRKAILFITSVLVSVGLVSQPAWAMTRAELMYEIYTNGAYSGYYDVTGGDCSDDVFDSPYLGFQLLHGDTGTAEITQAYLGFSTATWSDGTGTLRKKAGKNYFVIRVTAHNSTYGRITYVARVRKSNPDAFFHERVTLTNFPDGNGTCDATVSGQ